MPRTRAQGNCERSHRLLELSCWGLGAVLLAFYFGARAHGESERQDGIAKFAEARAAMKLETASAWRSESSLLEPLGLERSELPDSGAQAQTTDAPSGTTPPKRPEAVLRIDRVGLEVPVYADVGERNLNRGAGLIAGTALPGSEGNVAIAAHRDGNFRVLERVVVGDLIALESLIGTRRYRVTELSVVEPDDLRPLHALGVPAVTLVTCYPFYFVGNAPQRFIVRAVASD